MIRIAVCDHDAIQRRRVRDAVERYARETGINNVYVVQFASVEGAVRVAGRMRPGYFDVAFCNIDPTVLEQPDAVSAAIEQARKLREEQPDVRLVIVSNDKSQAIHAYNHDVGFLLMSGTYDDFTRAAADPLAAAARKHSAVMAVKTGRGVQNVVLADVQFVESSKRGPIIHLPAGKTAPVRGTLQTLFDNLSSSEALGPADNRFVKAGNSFIVNLDNVRSAGEGSLVFADGETIIVPVRRRKDVLDALDSYWVRA